MEQNWAAEMALIDGGADGDVVRGMDGCTEGDQALIEEEPGFACVEVLAGEVDGCATE